MIRLWEVEVEVRYTVVVAAENQADAEHQAGMDYTDAEPDDPWVSARELEPGDAIPTGWADAEPFGMPDEVDGRTVQELLDYIEDTRPEPRCRFTRDLFGNVTDPASQAAVGAPETRPAP